MVALLISTSSPAAAVALPSTFVGVNSPDVFAGTEQYRNNTLEREAHAGITLIRQVFDWAQIEPSRGVYDFSEYDQYVLDLAAHGFDIMPILFDAPAWATGSQRNSGGYHPPKNPWAIKPFAQALIRRYGPNGALWSAHPEIAPRPIHLWQIWNEPDLNYFWGGHPDPDQYAQLLRAARSGLHSVDPSAQVITAGLAFTTSGSGLGPYIQRLIRDVGGHVSALAVNAYARKPRGILGELRFARSSLVQANASRLPIWLTEFGWASGGPASPFTVSPSKQGTFVRATISMLAQQRCALRLRGFMYYTWQDASQFPANSDTWTYHTGLLTATGQPKPALGAFSHGSAAAASVGCP